MWYEWFFDGIGTEIVMLVIGLISGGLAGYRIGIRRNSVQKQRAEDGAKQAQRINITDENSKEGGINGNLRQIQKAGKNAEQNQIGTIK